MNSVVGAEAAKLAKKMKQGDDQEQNVGGLLESIKEDIWDCYNNLHYKLGDDTDKDSKSAIALLHEIELVIYQKMTEIDYIYKDEKEMKNMDPTSKE